MKGILTPALLFALFATTAAANDAENAIFYEDPRMVEAGGLLSDREQYDRAAALYRDVLGDEPDHSAARLWLARVLSWKGDHDDSLSEYKTLLDDPSAPENIEVERAEVLSWAGRYDEAEVAFDAVLEQDPQDVRALLGKARVYKWSSRKARAAKTYEEVLVLHPDPEIRRELDELNSSLGTGGDGRARNFSDSQGFSITTIDSSATIDLDFSSRMIATLAYSHVKQNRPILGPFANQSSDGLAGYVGLEHDFTDNLQGSAAIGYRWWEIASGNVLFRAALEYELPTDTALGLKLDYGDFLSRSESFNALLVGLDSTTVRAQAWQGMPANLSAFGYLDTTFVSDSNTRVGIGASGEYQPFSRHDLRLGVSVDYLTFTDRSILYYSPTSDVGASVSLAGSRALFDWLAVNFRTSVGAGFVQEAGLSGSGLSYGVAGGLELRYEGLRLSAHAGRSQSQRSSTYTTHTYGGSIDLEF
jgi:tetratricopeptide (TPR) repeat protein